MSNSMTQKIVKNPVLAMQVKQGREALIIAAAIGKFYLSTALVVEIAFSNKGHYIFSFISRFHFEVILVKAC